MTRPRVGPVLNLGSGSHVDLSEVLARHQEPERPYRRPSGRTWYDISAAAARVDDGPSYAEIYLYDEIGFFGVSAGSFIAQLNELDVDEIDLHINSPGGDLFDGVAIYQALVEHRAEIYCYVDGLAASIASVIAMAGDRVTMAEMSRMFIHDAWGFCQGNAQDMRTMAEMLDDFSTMIAQAYAGHAGGTPAQWRKQMQAETWFSPQQAVEAGLADAIAKKAKKDDDEPAAARRRHDREDYPWLRRVDAPVEDAQPVDEPGDTTGRIVLDPEKMPEGPPPGLDIAAWLTEALTPPPAPPPLEPGLLAAVLRDELSNAPAAPDTPAPPPPAPPVDVAKTVTSALEEALSP